MVKQQKNAPLTKQKNKPKAIQSYLYKKPIRVIKKTTQKLKYKPAVDLTRKKQQKNNSLIFKTKKSKLKEKSAPELTTNLVKESSALQKNTQNKATTKTHNINSQNNLSISAFTQLENLKSSINKKIIAKEFAHKIRPRGYSAMTDLPKAVKHSEKQLTAIEKKEKMTTNYGSYNDIIKNDDGTCTLKQDLSNVGMEGITALSGFKCGQTKMEKMYDAHMNKVLEKLGKKKRR